MRYHPPRPSFVPPMPTLRPTLTCISILLLFPTIAWAGDDYDPDSQEWNGLSEFVAMGEELGTPVVSVDRLDVGELGESDALVVLYPQRDLPIEAIASFIRAGGRLALLDDYGRGAALLRAYGISRTEADLGATPNLRSNPNLPVAQSTTRHALTSGVSGLVANHPVTLRHEKLDALFSFDDAGHALVLAGAVGEGRLVAVGDPSIVINNMLELRDNRRFAENLYRYLNAAGGGTVYLVTGDGELFGRFGEPGADRPFYDLSRWLEDLAGARTPAAALLIGAIALSAILLVVAATSLPRRTPYDGSQMFARLPASGGFVGRVGYFAGHPQDLFAPTLVYKFEFEGELMRLLELTERPALRDVLAALEGRGFSAAEVIDAQALLVELDALREQRDRSPRPPRVSPSRFDLIVRRGEHILSRLDREAPIGV